MLSMCSGLKKNGPHRLIMFKCLVTREWYYLEGLESMALFEEVHH